MLREVFRVITRPAFGDEDIAPIPLPHVLFAKGE